MKFARNTVPGLDREHAISPTSTPPRRSIQTIHVDSSPSSPGNRGKRPMHTRQVSPQNRGERRMSDTYVLVN